MRTLLNVTLVLAPVAGSVMSLFSFLASVDFLLFLFLISFFLWLVLLSFVMLLLLLVCDVGFFVPQKCSRDMFSSLFFFFFSLFLPFTFYIFLPFRVLVVLTSVHFAGPISSMWDDDSSKCATKCVGEYTLQS